MSAKNKSEIVLTVNHGRTLSQTEVKKYIGDAIKTHAKGYRTSDRRRSITKPTFRFKKKIVTQEDAHAILESLRECYAIIEMNTSGLALDAKDSARMWLHKYGIKY